MKYIVLMLFAIVMVFTLSCSQRTTSTAEHKYEVIKHNQEKDLLQKEIEKISVNKTFPTLVESLKKSMDNPCLLYTSPSPRDRTRSRMPSSA